MLLSFTKMHGLGNDVVVFAASDAVLPSAAQFRQLGNRRTGIGFDQAMIVQAPRRADTDLYYRIFNADGSEVEQCGNGARCVAALVAKQRGQSHLRMDCPAGLVNADVAADDQVTIDMGVPDFTPSALPFIADKTAGRYEIDAAGQSCEIGAVSMGNPHAVLLVPDIDNAPVASLGPALESHARFPKRVNVGFMQVITPEHIRLRVYERGVGETQACGTGACAAVAIGRQRGLLGNTVHVDLLGGRLTISWSGIGEKLLMTGPAVTVYTGQVEI